MATKKQKEELIEVLKFTPVTYSVSIHGYGGEMVMGAVNPATVEYFNKNGIDLEEYATSWSEEGEDGYIEVPNELQPFSQGSWYDCDNIEHCSGAEFGGSWLLVEDEKGEVVLEVELGHNLEDLGCEVECFGEEDVDDHVNEKTAVFVGQTFEKGAFFLAELNLRAPFDISKFKFVYSDVAGWSVLNTIMYNGEELDGSDGYNSAGKSSSYEFFYIDNSGNIANT